MYVILCHNQNTNTMETKHTKGEWSLQSNVAKRGAYPAYELTIDFNDFHTDCVTVYCNEETPSDIELANAKLIAAAPELLEALIKIKKLIAFNQDSEMGLIINNAIKKTTE